MRKLDTGAMLSGMKA